MIFNRFPSVESFISSMVQKKDAMKASKFWNRPGDFHGADWNLGVNSDLALHQAVAGDNRLASMANDAISKLELQIGETSKKRNAPYFSGSRVSVPAYLSGNPKAMIRRERQTAQGQEITIYLGISANSKISSQDMLNRGCTVLALLETLQAQGVGINLSLYVDHTGYDNQLLMTVIDVETKPLDLSTAAFAIAHPAFVRAVCFPANAVLGGFAGYAGKDRFGRYLDQENYDNVVKNALDMKEGDIFIPRAMPHDALLSNPVAWLQERIRQVSSL